MKFELWHLREVIHSEDGRAIPGETYTLIPSDHAQKQILVKPGAKLILVIEAETWEDACRQEHEFLGWEPYKPMPDQH